MGRKSALYIDSGTVGSQENIPVRRPDQVQQSTINPVFEKVKK